MPSPIAVRCPSCQTRLKIQNPQAIGKKVRCPKCEVPFTVRPPVKKPAAAAPPEDDFGLDDFDSYEDDSYEDDFDDDGGGRRGRGRDDFEDEFGPPPTRRRSGAGAGTRGAGARGTGARGGSRRPAGKGKSKKGKSQGVNWIPFALIGGGVVAVGLLVGLVIWLLPGGGKPAADGNVVDMTWIPPDSDVLMHARTANFLSQPKVVEAMERPDTQRDLKEFEEATGVTVHDIESVTIGMPRGADGMPDSGRVVGILRFSKALSKSALSRDSELSPQEYNGKTYYASTKGHPMCLFMPDVHTLVMAEQAGMQAAIDTNGQAVRRTRFDFIDADHDMVFAYVPEDPSTLRAQMAMPQMGQMAAGMPANISGPLQQILSAVQTGFAGVALGGDVNGQDLALALQVQCETNDAASQMGTAVNELITQGKTFYEAFKMGKPADVVATMDEVIDSLSVSHSGQTVALSLNVPGALEQMNSGNVPFMPGGGFGPGGFGGFGGDGAADNGGATGNPILDARRAAQRTQSKNNLKQIGLAFHNYHDTFRKFPVADNPQQRDASGKPKLSWRVHILPFVEHGDLYEQFHLDEPWDSPHNKALIARMPDIYRRPGSNAPPGHTNYLTVTGPGAVFEGGDGRAMRDVTDGLTNTILVVEVEDEAAVIWTRPDDYEYDPADPTRDLLGADNGFNALFGDGVIRFISGEIDPQTLIHLFQRNDGQRVDIP